MIKQFKNLQNNTLPLSESEPLSLSRLFGFSSGLLHSQLFYRFFFLKMFKAYLQIHCFQMPDIDYSQYNEHFSQKADSIRAGPVQDQYRSCHDICCSITFFVLIVGMLVLGIISISDGKTVFETNTNVSGFAILGEAFTKYGGIIGGMFALALLLSIIYVFLVKKFPKCMVYTMIVLTFLLYIGLAVLGFIIENYYIAGIALLMILITAIMLCCCWRKLKIGIQLLKAAGQFITEKPGVYGTTLYGLFFGILFFLFWIFAFIAVTYSLNQKASANQDQTKEIIFIVFFIFMLVFMDYFLGYIQIFLIATACSFWYYDIKENYCGTGVKRVNRYHLGSITFGAIIIAIINLLKRVANQESGEQMAGGNSCAAVCLCLVGCCLSCIEGLLHALNYNAVITMSVTGQSYINSAKSAIGLIFENFSLYYIVDFIADMITFFGILLAAGIPTLIAFLITRYGQGDSFDTNEVIGTTIVVFILSLVLSSFIISMIGQALQCIFIFYCFDKKFLSMGINVTNVPSTIRNLQGYSDYAPGSGQELQGRNY